MRRSLDLSEGDTAVWDVRNNKVHLSTRKKLLEKANTWFQKPTPPSTQAQRAHNFLNKPRNAAARDEPALGLTHTPTPPATWMPATLHK